MFGFFEIIIVLTAFLVVLVGVQIFQTAYLSDSPRRSGGMAIGASMVILALAIGLTSVWLVERQIAQFNAESPSLR